MGVVDALDLLLGMTMVLVILLFQLLPIRGYHNESSFYLTGNLGPAQPSMEDPHT